MVLLRRGFPAGGLVVIRMEIKMALIPCTDIYSFVRKNDLYMIKSTKIVFYYYDQVDHAWKAISKSGVEQTACVAESKNKGERTLVAFYNLLENEERVVGRQRNAMSLFNGGKSKLVRREPSGEAWSRLYFPDKNPPASGLQIISPNF